jgi:hypothetical protein
VAKKKTGLRGTLFREIDPYAKEAGGEESEQLIRIPIGALRPDPGQPRRLLPQELAHAISGGELGPKDAIEEWRILDTEQGEALDHNLQELRRLADSIEKQGLINPITVRRPGDAERVPGGVDYVIVTGERRYWAHVLLAADNRSPLVDDRGETLLVAREVPEGTNIRAHQLIENIMREDINAVEKAEGLVALRQELSEVNYSSLDGSDEAEKPVPWTAVSEILGISDRYRIYMTSVLRLPKEAQAVIAENNLAEMTIRPIVQKLKGSSALQIAALRQVSAWQSEERSKEAPGQAITGAVRELVDALLVQGGKVEKAAEAVAQAAEAVRRWPEAARFRSKVRGALRYLDQLPEGDFTLLARDLALDANYSSVVDELQELRQQLDSLLHRVSEYQESDEDQ